MSDSKWAPIVYGRTYEVDFRFIVTPEDFEEKELEWVANYIRVTTRTPEKLPNNPRWLLLKSRRYCLVGVTCMVRELIASTNFEGAEDFTRDSQGRPLYVFVGYIAQKSPEAGVLDCPTIPPMDLRCFAKLYDYVRQRWLEKSYDLSRQEVEKSYRVPYVEELDVTTLKEEADAEFSHAETDITYSIYPENLNYLDKEKNEDVVYIWGIENNQNLWQAASQYSGYLSLCIGLPSEKNFLEGPFLNGTSLDIKAFKQLNKRVNKVIDAEQNVSPVDRQAECQKNEERERANQSRSVRVSPDEGLREQRNRKENPEPEQVKGFQASSHQIQKREDRHQSFPKRQSTRNEESLEQGTSSASAQSFLNFVGEMASNLGDAFSAASKDRIEEKLRQVEIALEDVFVSLEKQQDSLGRAQADIAWQKCKKVRERVKVSKSQCFYRDYKKAEEFVDEAINLLNEVRDITQQRHIDFRPKSEVTDTTTAPKKDDPFNPF
ncbi:MAG: hypothetical protein SAK29_08325 [Scytonema sp. PMC 1069.18]|nr:hypothetical protein [Scytonema sp. PMC 1069.18]MEC4880183.1 hypothetical protein [Scytonema sp. PMC 1070.18]